MMDNNATMAAQDQGMFLKQLNLAAVAPPPTYHIRQLAKIISQIVEQLFWLNVVQLFLLLF